MDNITGGSVVNDEKMFFFQILQEAEEGVTSERKKQVMLEKVMNVFVSQE